MQTGVGSAAGHQLGVGAAFADLAVFQHENNVRAANGSETVRYDERGAADHEIAESALHVHLRLGVQFRGGFIEDKDG